MVGRPISIHALLAESDSQQPDGTTRTTYFYPRSPCGERPQRSASSLPSRSISIHALLAESDNDYEQYYIRAQISIHALLAESDDAINGCNPDFEGFLSTLSLRRATGHDIRGRVTQGFLSTLSLRRATPRVIREPATSGFLSTLSLRRATLPASAFIDYAAYFYPRSPCGERRPLFFSCWLLAYFYPRSPCGERPFTMTTTICTVSFLSTLSLRRATIYNRDTVL